jgi:WD40 repeat protein
VESALRFRKRSADGATLLDTELSTWQQCLHRFDQSDALAKHSELPGREATSVAGHGARLKAEATSPNAAVSVRVDRWSPPRAFCALFGTKPSVPSGLRNDNWLLNGDSKYLQFKNAGVELLNTTLANTALPPSSASPHDQVVTSLTSHPSLPFYLSANVKAEIFLWHFGESHPLAQFAFKNEGKDNKDEACQIKQLRFDPSGDKFACTTTLGQLAWWTFEPRSVNYGVAASIRPSAAIDPDALKIYACDVLKVHDRMAADLVFIGGGFRLATCGDNFNQNNVCVFDSLYAETVAAFRCHPGGAHSLAFLAEPNYLVSGGSKGDIIVFNLSTLSVLYCLPPHKALGHISRLEIDSWRGLLLAGTSAGVLRVYAIDMSAKQVEQLFTLKHEEVLSGSHTFFNHVTGFGMVSSFGITDVCVAGLGVYVCCADGSIKYMRKYEDLQVHKMLG